MTSRKPGTRDRVRPSALADETGAIKSDGHLKPLFCEDSASRPPSRCWRRRLEAPAFFRQGLVSTRLRQSLAGPGSHSGGRFRLRPSPSEGLRPGRYRRRPRRCIDDIDTQRQCPAHDLMDPLFWNITIQSAPRGAAKSNSGDFNAALPESFLLQAFHASAVSA